MYKDLIGENVTVIVSSRGDIVYEYHGILDSESDGEIKLSDVSINAVLSSFQKNVFGNNMSIYANNLKTVILNKRYIISCNKN